MKKVITTTIALVLVICLFSTVAYGETPSLDLSTYTLDELSELYNSVRTELFIRIKIDSENLIGRGVYVVGKDIMAGTYDLIILETDTDYSGNPINYYGIGEETEDGSYDEILSSENLTVGEHIIASLAEGQTLALEGCVCYITPINPSWAP